MTPGELSTNDKGDHVMTDHAEPAPLWLRILQFPPIKLFLLGYPLFYCTRPKMLQSGRNT